MSQKIKTSVEIDGSLKASQIANATTDTDKFLVSDSGTVKYRTGAEVLSDLGITVNTASKLQHQVKAGVTINKGQAVYVTSADGTNMIVGLASNASEATSSKTMGLLDGTVAINGFANVVTEGLLSGLSITGAVSEGDPVWLGTGGNLIYGLTNKPSAPNHLVFIGIVTRVNANNGEIFVKVQNGFELDEIHDVDLKTTAKINGHLLGYNGSLWVNKTIAEWLGYTPYNASNPAGYISSYTETDTLASVTARGALTNTPIAVSSGTLNHVSLADRFNLIGGSNFHITNNAYYDSGFKYKFADLATKLALQADGILSYQTAVTGTIGTAVTFDTKFSVDSSGNLIVPGTLTASGYNKTNWDTAYGWGNHASAGYLTSVTNITGYARSLNGFANQTEYTILDGPANGPVWKVRYDSATANRYIDFGFKDGNGVYSTGLKIYNGDTPTWQGSTLLHAGNYSSYAVPSSRTITINGTSYDLSANRSWTVTASEIDTLATVTARGNTTTGDVNINGKIRVGSFPNSTVNNGEAWLGRAADRLAGTMTVQLGGNLDRKFEVVDYGWTTVNFSVNGYGAAEASGSMRAPIFYDSNDTSYYADFNSTSQEAVRQRGGTLHGPNTTWGAYLLVGGNGRTGYINNALTASVVATDGNLHLDAGSAKNMYFNWYDGGAIIFGNGSESQIGYMSSAGDFTANSSSRSPIFYDSNDTGYYWNPATDASHRFQTPSGYIDIGPKNSGTCHIYTDRPSFYFNKDLIVNGSTVLNTSNAPRAANSYVMFYEGFTLNADSMSTNSTGFTYSNGAPWTGPVARFSTGGGYDLWLNASYGGNGTGLSYRTRNGDAGTYNSWHRIYSDSYRPYADDSGTTGQRSFNYLYASSYLESGGAVYGTIFYDNNNRGYYMDPDGTSQLSSIYTNNWVRVQGDSGVYSQDYGGHLRRPVNASHGTWEIFGYNKNGYAGMNVYDPQGYNNNYMHESGNGGLYQQNGNGWIFYHSRGNACFGVMTSSTSSSYKLYVGGSIYAEGDIVAYSDRRKKENIVTVDNALNTVNKLRGVYYNRIDDDSKKRQIGVIAQEIQEVLPEVVTHAKDVDEYGVSYGNITGLLIEAIKEQQQQIEELKQLVNNLINK